MLTNYCLHSSDGTIKVWEENKTLLTELTLDESLSSVSFLNNKGDVAIGFRNHVFFIDHSRGIVNSLPLIADSNISKPTSATFLLTNCQIGAPIFQSVLQ